MCDCAVLLVAKLPARLFPGCTLRRGAAREERQVQNQSFGPPNPRDGQAKPLPDFDHDGPKDQISGSNLAPHIVRNAPLVFGLDWQCMPDEGQLSRHSQPSHRHAWACYIGSALHELGCITAHKLLLRDSKSDRLTGSSSLHCNDGRCVPVRDLGWTTERAARIAPVALPLQDKTGIKPPSDHCVNCRFHLQSEFRRT